MIRFAVWAAVSTIEQVEGASLDNQLDKCKERGKSEGWTDSGLFYVADGYSRTGYVNLSDAETDIPPLGNMLADMRANKFDLLILWNYDRMGDLILMVATEFRNKKKQLYSLSQPTPVQAIYNPYMDDSSFIMQALAPVWQKQRIADLRRKWETGMPRRMTKGLPPGKTPYGYRLATERNKPPEIVPAEAALVRNMYRLLMEGKSLQQIARECTQSGLLTKRGKAWGHSDILNILRNPYHAGIVEWRKSRYVEGKKIPVPLSQRTTYEGNHEPIFTPEQHAAILAELNRRKSLDKRYLSRYPLTGMLICGVCGERLHKDIANGKPILRERGDSCKRYQYAETLEKIVTQIQKESLERRNVRTVEKSPIDYSVEIKELESRIERVQQSAELGVYTPVQAAKRVSELQSSLDDIYRRKNETEQAEKNRASFDDSFDELESMGEWIMNFDPATVNRILQSIIKRILLFPDKIIIDWR